VVACIVLALLGALLMVTARLRSGHDAPDLGLFLEGLGYGEPEDRLAEPLVSRVLTGGRQLVSGGLERVLPRQNLERIRRQLAQAGLTGKRRPGEQLAMQLGLGAGGAALALLLPPGPPLRRVLTVALLAATGFMAPAARQNFPSPLTDELRKALQDMELGLPRREALQAFRDRVDLDVVRTLVLALLQADALGVPIGRVLKSQATEVRARRRGWAREKAGKLPVKIMFPLVLFIFPPILALVLGPAASSFTRLGN
jgi:hypothetical protein